MADEEDIAALVIDNGSGMCKGRLFVAIAASLAVCNFNLGISELDSSTAVALGVLGSC